MGWKGSSKATQSNPSTISRDTNQIRMQPLEIPKKGCSPWGCQERDAGSGMFGEGSQKNRIVWVGKDLEKSTSPSPCSEQGHLQLHQDRMQPMEMPREACSPWECQEKNATNGMPGKGYQERDEVPRKARKRCQERDVVPWASRLTQTCPSWTRDGMMGH